MRNGLLVAVLLTWVGTLAGQTNGSDAIPRTPWGDPDLQGTWSTEAELSVPFERPREYGERPMLTDSEYAQRLARSESQIRSDNSDFDLESADRSNAGQVGSATSPPPHWLERSKVSRRTSLVIDPPDGRLPTLVQQVRARGADEGGAVRPNQQFNGPEDLGLWTRCIGRSGGAVPTAIFPQVYNANVQIIQSPGVVAITYEMVHDTRIVLLGGGAHVGTGVRGYAGDARGRWDGNTLVVDTTSFIKQSGFYGSRGETLRLTERCTRQSDGIRYVVTVSDPTTWTRPWTAALTMAPQPDGALFEYACHEGNHSMRNILSAARAAERDPEGR
jgi:hypothetical protein